MKAENYTQFFLLGIIFLALVYFRWFLPFPHVASDLHVTFQEELLGQTNPPFTWGSEGAVGLGEFSVFSIWNWPVEFLFGVLGNLGFSHNALNQYVALGLGIIFAAWGTELLLKEYRINYVARVVATLFYLTNTYILLLIDGGQLAIALAYFFFPLSYFTLKKSISGGIREKIIASLTIFLVGVFDVRFVYLIAIIGGLEFISGFFLIKKDEVFPFLQRWFSAGFVIFTIFILLNFYWILPAILQKAPSLPLTYGRDAQVGFLSFANLGHSLYLLQPHWFKNVFGKVTELKPEFVLIPVLVFLAPVLRRKSREVGFWLLVALVGVFLVKGANEPLPSVYPWLFVNIPGFSLFRDPTKFFFLVALSYSVLIGVTVDELVKRFNWSFKFIPLILASYFIILARPVWLGQMTGTFAKPVYQKEFFEVANILEKDEEFSRVFWIPTKAPLGYSSPTHPSVEAARLVQKRPFAIGTVGTYELFNFLREAPFMGELFNIAGIKYIAYPFPDIRREELKQDNVDYYYAFLDQLSNLEWIDTKISEAPVAALKTEKSQGHFFLAQNTFCIVGSDRIYWDLAEQSVDFSKNALVFLEEQAGLVSMVKDTPCTYLLYDNEIPDLAATFIDKSRFIFPAQSLDFDPDPSASSGQAGWPANNALRNNAGWWKRESADLIRWRDFLQQKYGIDNLDFDYGGGWAISEGNRNFQFPRLRRGFGGQAISNFQSGDILFARVMESSRGGKIEFFQGEEKIGEINTRIENPEEVKVKLTGYQEIPDQLFKYNKASVRWFEVGALVNSNQSLQIRTSGDINVVNALISIPEEEWASIDRLVRQYDVVNWDELTNRQKSRLFEKKDEAKLTYERISPTHYKVVIDGLSQPTTLAFSETYDSLWQLDGQPSYPLYSLINGFRVERDGEYDIVFSAQRYVLSGLYISSAILFVAVTSLVFLRKRKTN